MAYLATADAERLPLATQSIDVTIGSPPYCDARTYGIGAARGAVEWVQWMLRVTAEAQRVTRGPVIWVAAGVTRDRCYWPACEGLMWEWWKQGGECQLYRPVYWHRVGISGSGGDQWYRADIEYCMCFKRPGSLPWSDNTAFGHPPLWGPGGEMSHRLTDGTRRNQWGGGEKSGSQRRKNGSRQTPSRPSHVVYRKSMKTTGERGDVNEQGYVPPALANPGNVLRDQWVEDGEECGQFPEGRVFHVRVGGGHMGHWLAHESEAPYPEDVPRFFIGGLCPPGGTVLDPFSGSGTTVAVAEQMGRIGLGFDLRHSQGLVARERVEDTRRRLERPHAPKRPRKAKESVLPLWEQAS